MKASISSWPKKSELRVAHSSRGTDVRRNFRSASDGQEAVVGSRSRNSGETDRWARSGTRRDLAARKSEKRTTAAGLPFGVTWEEMEGLDGHDGPFAGHDFGKGDFEAPRAQRGR